MSLLDQENNYTLDDIDKEIARRRKSIDDEIGRRETAAGITPKVKTPSWGEVITKAPASGLAGVNVGLARDVKDIIKLADYPTRAARKVFGIKEKRPDVGFLEKYIEGQQKRQAELDMTGKVKDLPWYHPKKVAATGLPAIPQVAAVAGAALMAPPTAARSAAAAALATIAYGSAAEEAKAEDASEVKQVLHGLTSAEIEVLTELPVFGSVGQLWKYLKAGGVGKKAGVSFISRLLKGFGLFGKSMAFETVQEMEAYLGGQMSKRLHYDPDAPITLEAMKEAGYGGATMSAVLFGLGAPGMAAKLAAKPITKKGEADDTLLLTEATNLINAIDKSMATKKIGATGRPFTPDLAIAVIKQGYDDNILTAEDLESLAERYPELKNGIIGGKISSEITQEIQAAEKPISVRGVLGAEDVTAKELLTGKREKALTSEARQEIIEAEMPVPEPTAEVAREEIPTFKNTGEAEAFGKKATPEQITELKQLRQEALDEYEVLEKADINKAMVAATKGQLYREALESAEKPTKEVAPEKVEVGEEPWRIAKDDLLQVPEKFGFKFVQKTITDFFPELEGSNIITKGQRVFIVEGKKAPKTSMDESGNITINLTTLKEGTDIVDVVLKDKATDDIRFNYSLLHEIDHKISLLRKERLPSEGEIHVSKLADDYLATVKQAIKENNPIPPITKIFAEYPDLTPAKPPTSKLPKPTPKSALTDEVKGEGIVEESLNAILKKHGYVSEKTDKPGRKNILKGKDIVLEDVTSEEVWKWVKAKVEKEKAEVAPEKVTLSQELKTLTDKLAKKGKRYKDTGDFDSILGGETFTPETRRLVNEIRFILEEDASLIKNIPKELGAFFESYPTIQDKVEKVEVETTPEGEEITKYTEGQRKVFAQYEGKIRVAKRLGDTKEAERLRRELNKLKAKPIEKPADVKARLIENIKSEKGESALINDLSILGADAIRKGHDSFKAFSAQMKIVLSEVWDKIKHLMRQAYDAAKTVLKSERGAIGGIKAIGAPTGQLVKAQEMLKRIATSKSTPLKTILNRIFAGSKFSFNIPESHPRMKEGDSGIDIKAKLFGGGAIIGDASTLEISGDSATVNIKSFGDLAKVQSFIEHGFDFMDIESKRVVIANMISASRDFKIRKAIVESIPIDVMNNLRRQKFSSDMLLHDQSMLQNLFAINLEGSIPIGMDIARSIIVSETPSITKISLVDFRRYPVKYSSATVAKNLQHDISSRKVSDTIPASEEGVKSKVIAGKTISYEAEGIPREDWIITDGKGTSFSVEEGKKFATKPTLDYKELIREYQKAYTTLPPVEKAPPKVPSAYEKGKDDWFGNKDWAEVQHAVERGKLQDDIRDTVSVKKNTFGKKIFDQRSRDVDAAIHLYLDLKRNPAHRTEYYKDLPAEWKKIVDKIDLVEFNPKLKAIADYIRTEGDKTGKMALEADVIHNQIENHVNRVWKKRAGISERSYTDALQKFKTKSRHAKHRTFDTILEGLALKDKSGKHIFDLQIRGATSNLQTLKDEISRVIEDKKLITEMRKTKTEDGDPLLSTHRINDTYIKIEHPNFKVWEFATGIDLVEKTIDKATGLAIGDSIRAKDRGNIGKIIAITDKGIDVHFVNKKEGTEKTISFKKDAIGKLEQPLIKVTPKGINFFITNEGTVLEKRELYAPKKIARDLNKILGVSRLKGVRILGVPAIDILTKYNAIFKSWILVTSFFHHQAFLRSYELPSQHKTLAEWNPSEAYKMGKKAIENMVPEIELLVRNGLTMFKMQDWEESILRREDTIFGKILDRNTTSKAIKDKINELRERQANFLFGNFGAALKTQAALIELRNMTRKHPEMDVQERAKMVARLINDDFGGLHLGRMGRDPTIQHIMRLLLLAPDWTESNVRTMVKAFKSPGGPKETAMYRRFWTSTITKGLSAIFVANILMAALDDDDFEERYKKSWKAGHFRWLDIDITPIYKMFGGKSEARKYFSLFGHFRDPLKFIRHPIRSLHHKGSVVYGTFHEAMSGTDWKGQKFTTLQELIGIDDKGVYLTTTKKHRAGDPKGGKLAGKLVTYGGKGPISLEQMPSYMVSQLIGIQPIQIQNLIAMLTGEVAAFDGIARSLGMHTGTTYPTTKSIREDFIEEYINLREGRKSAVNLQKKVRKYNLKHKGNEIIKWPNIVEGAKKRQDAKKAKKYRR